MRPVLSAGKNVQSLTGEEEEEEVVVVVDEDEGRRECEGLRECPQAGRQEEMSVN